jgi:hypothetical protein
LVLVLPQGPEDERELDDDHEKGKETTEHDAAMEKKKKKTIA